MGRARRFNQYDKAVKDSRLQAEAAGRLRQDLSGIGSSFRTLPQTPPQGPGGVNRDSSKIGFQFGGQLRGPLAFEAQTAIIKTGNLAIDKDNQATPAVKQAHSLIFVIPESGTADTLDTVSGKIHDGQILILTGVAGNTITITHNFAGDSRILCPNDANFTLSDDESVILIDDVTSTPNAWRLIAGSQLGDDLGNHTATENLNMATFNLINVGVLGQSGTEATAGFIRMINNVAINWRNAANTADFGINGNASDQVEFSAPIVPSTNGTFDFGSTTKPWNSGYFDNTLFVNNLKEFTLGDDINVHHDLDIATGATIDFADTSTAGASEGFVVIKVNGVAKRLEYFAVA